jgi:hypothetical protein
LLAPRLDPAHRRHVDASDAVRLDLSLGRPILVVDSTDVDADRKPLLTTPALAAERIEFVVENTRARYTLDVQP